MSDIFHHDLIIIGGGPAGYSAASRAASRGMRAIIFEKKLLGGACLNRGCVPTKSWVAAAETLDHVPHMLKLARAPFTYDLDFSKVQALRKDVVQQASIGLAKMLYKNTVPVVEATAVFKKPGFITIGEDAADYPYKQALIATGSAPIRPFDLDRELMWDSDNIFDHDTLPASMLIIGGGYIGCEFACALTRFGVEVTVVEMMETILPMADKEVSATVAREMKKQKIKLMTGVTIARVEAADEGVKAILADGRELTAERSFVSVGRRPVTEGLGLENVGVTLEPSGHVKVDHFLATTAPKVYAAGDVIRRDQLAYTAYREGAYVADRVGRFRLTRLNDVVVPKAIFTIPEVGSVGLTEQEAPEGSKIGMFMMRTLARAQSTGELAGFVKVVSDRITDRILGVHIVGARATDLIHIASVALAGQLTTTQLGEQLFAHPAFAEAIGEAVLDVDDLALHAVHKIVDEEE